MKKQISYLILLSLMACKKPDCTGDAVTPLPIEEPKKPPLVDCKLPTRNRDTAQTLIVGKWRLTRTVYASWFLGKYIYKNESELPKTIVQFDNIGNFKYFLNDTLRTESNYGFYKLSEINNYPKDSSINVIHLPKVDKVSFGTLTTYKICDDSLYLPFNSFREDAIPDLIFRKLKD